MKKTLKVFITVVLVITMLSSTAAFAMNQSAKVITASMACYNGSKQLVGSLGRGTSIKVTALKGGWVRFTFKGATLYSQLSNIAFDNTIAGITNKDTHFEFVTKTSWASGVYYKATLAAGTPVYVCGKSGNKYLVCNAGKTAYGYVAASAVNRV